MIKSQETDSCNALLGAEPALLASMPDGIDRTGRQVSSGVYVVHLRAQGESAARTITLLE